MSASSRGSSVAADLRTYRSLVEAMTVSLGVFAGVIWAFALQQSNNLDQAIVTLHTAAPGCFPDTIKSAFGFNIALLAATQYTLLPFLLFFIVGHIMFKKDRPNLSFLLTLLTMLIFAAWVYLFVDTFFGALPSPTYQEIVTPTNAVVSSALTELNIFMSTVGYYVAVVRVLIWFTLICVAIAIMARAHRDPWAWASLALPAIAWYFQGYIAAVPVIVSESCQSLTITESGGIRIGGISLPPGSDWITFEMWILVGLAAGLAITGLIGYLNERWPGKVPRMLVRIYAEVDRAIH